MLPWHYWLIAGIILCILEMFTGDMILLGLGFAAVGASIAASFDATLTWQLVFFSAFALIFIFLIRPVAKRHFYKSSDTRKSNVDALIGRKGTVIVPIPVGLEPGRVKIGGETWRAVSDLEEVIEEGTKISVQSVEGATVTVSPTSQ